MNATQSNTETVDTTSTTRPDLEIVREEEEAPRRGRRIIHNGIENPINVGDLVTIPMGVYVHTGNGAGHVSRRSVDVEVIDAEDGWVDVYDSHKQGKGYVILPTVSWRASGGRVYWTKVTPEFCALNRVAPGYLPRQELAKRSLDNEPTYGPGYDNRDVL